MSLRETASVVRVPGPAGEAHVVTVTEPRTAGADTPEFIAWAEKRRPSAVREVKQVTRTGLASILAELHIDGDTYIDPVTGEVVPGLHPGLAQFTYVVQR